MCYKKFWKIWPVKQIIRIHILNIFFIRILKYPNVIENVQNRGTLLHFKYSPNDAQGFDCLGVLSITYIYTIKSYVVRCNLNIQQAESRELTSYIIIFKLYIVTNHYGIFISVYTHCTACVVWISSSAHAQWQVLLFTRLLLEKFT